MLAFAACSSDDSVTDPAGNTGATGDDLDTILEEAGLLAPLADEQHKIDDSRKEVDNGVEYTYEVHDVVDNIDSIVYLGLNDNIIWPGSVIQGKDAHRFVYVPVGARRAPITLSVSLENSVTRATSVSRCRIPNSPAFARASMTSLHRR